MVPEYFQLVFHFFVRKITINLCIQNHDKFNTYCTRIAKYEQETLINTQTQKSIEWNF